MFAVKWQFAMLGKNQPVIDSPRGQRSGLETGLESSSPVKSAKATISPAFEFFVIQNSKDIGGSPRSPIRPICETWPGLLRAERAAVGTSNSLKGGARDCLKGRLPSLVSQFSLTSRIVSCVASPDNCPPIWRLCHGWALAAAEQLNLNIHNRRDYRVFTEDLCEGRIDAFCADICLSLK